jgi:hypothetical protein
MLPYLVRRKFLQAKGSCMFFDQREIKKTYKVHWWEFGGHTFAAEIRGR